MGGPSPTTTIVLRAVTLMMLAFVISACQPPDDENVYWDVAQRADGSVIALADSPESWSSAADPGAEGPAKPALASVDGGRTWAATSVLDAEELLGRGGRPQACLNATPNVCISVAADGAVAESVDGGTTWKQVWDLGTETGWAAPLRVDVTGEEPDRPRIETFDVLVLADDEVFVALGQLQPIRRDLDGTWTPSVRALRGVAVVTLLPLFLATSLLSLSVAVGVGPTRSWSNGTFKLIVVSGVATIVAAFSTFRFGFAEPPVAVAIAAAVTVALHFSQWRRVVNAVMSETNPADAARLTAAALTFGLLASTLGYGLWARGTTHLGPTLTSVGTAWIMTAVSINLGLQRLHRADLLVKGRRMHDTTPAASTT